MARSVSASAGVNHHQHAGQIRQALPPATRAVRGKHGRLATAVPHYRQDADNANVADEWQITEHLQHVAAQKSAQCSPVFLSRAPVGRELPVIDHQHGLAAVHVVIPAVVSRFGTNRAA